MGASGSKPSRSSRNKVGNLGDISSHNPPPYNDLQDSGMSSAQVDKHDSTQLDMTRPTGRETCKLLEEARHRNEEIHRPETNAEEANLGEQLLLSPSTATNLSLTVPAVRIVDCHQLLQVVSRAEERLSGRDETVLACVKLIDPTFVRYITDRNAEQAMYQEVVDILANLGVAVRHLNRSLCRAREKSSKKELPIHEANLVSVLDKVSLTVDVWCGQLEVITLDTQNYLAVDPKLKVKVDTALCTGRGFENECKALTARLELLASVIR